MMGGRSQAMRSTVVAIVRDFCATEPLKLLRYLIDRLRCELDLSTDEIEHELRQVMADGWIRFVDISHYDPAIEDMTAETAVMPGPRLRDCIGERFAG